LLSHKLHYTLTITLTEKEPSGPTTQLLAMIPRSILHPVACIILALLSTLPATTTAADVSYKEGEGWLFDLFGKGRLNPDSALKVARDYVSNKQAGKAADSYRAIIKFAPLSPQAEAARFELATLLETLAEYDDAFERFEEYLKKNPNGPRFENAVESMYRIAKRYMDGEKRRVFGVKLFTSDERAQKMFESIIQQAPYSKFSARAQYNIGLLLERQGSGQEAIVAYQTVIERYPTDPVANDAQYQIGHVRMSDFRGGRYDRNAWLKARESFEDYVNRTPNSEKAAQARDNLKRLSSGEAKASLEIALFYDKSKKHKAAAAYYQDVVRDFSGTPEAKQAKMRLKELQTIIGKDALKEAIDSASETTATAPSKNREGALSPALRPDFAGPQAAPEPLAPAPKLRLSNQDLTPLPNLTSPQADGLFKPITPPATNESSAPNKN
jgi:outer membrane protein assembly factor BamD